MRKFWKKSWSLALALIMLCSTLTGVSFQMVTAVEAASELVKLDDQIIRDGYEYTQVGKVTFADWAGVLTPGITGNSEITLRQTKASAWQNRIQIATPAEIAMNSPIAWELKFKVAADDYNQELPTLKFGFRAKVDGTDIGWKEMGNNVIPISEANKDTWQTFRLVIDPDAKTVVGTLDSAQVISGTFQGDTANAISAMELNVTCTTASATGDGNALANPITWTYDAITVTGDASAPTQPTAPPSAGETMGTIYKVDTGLEVPQTNVVRQVETNSAVIVEDIGEAMGDPVVSGDKSQFSVSQTLASMYLGRFYFKDLYAQNLVIPGNSYLEVEGRFKVSPTDFESQAYLDAAAAGTLPTAKIRLKGENVFNWSECVSGLISLSTPEDEKWHTIKFVANPDDKVYCYLDGVQVATQTYADSPAANYGRMGFEPIVQNSGETGSDTATLAVPVTWTFDYVTIKQGGIDSGAGDATPPPAATPTPTPTPIPEVGDMLLIDDDMSWNAATKTLTQGESSITHVDYIGSSHALIGTDSLQVTQVKEAAYNSRLEVKTPQYYSMDQKTTLEVKFKVKTQNSDYTTAPVLGFMFDTNSAGIAQFMPTSLGVVPLSAATEDVVQTLKFIVDPDEKKVSVEINGNEITYQAFKASAPTDVFGDIKVRLMAMNSMDVNIHDENNRVALNTPVIWTFESFRTYQGEEGGGEATPEPSYAPLAEAASFDAWQSPAYATGTGKDDAKQLVNTTLDLGEAALINKVELNHDSSKVMAYSFSVSTDGINYKPLTLTYPGEDEIYDGEQLYRFAPVAARYVRYNATLLEAKETQAKLSNAKVSYADTTELDLGAVPATVNPILTDEVVLKATATDADGEYVMPNDGVIWSLEEEVDGVTLTGSSLRFASDAVGEVTVVATDASNDAVTESKTIVIAPNVAVKNFALYANEEGTEAIADLTAGDTVYAKAEVLADAEGREVQMVLAAYADKALIGVSTPVVEEASTDDYTPVTATLTLPESFDAADYVQAFIWDKDTLEPLSDSIVYGAAGSAAANVSLMKSHTIILSAAGADSWESTDAYIASVEDGVVTAKHEGYAVITAKKGGQTVATIPVKVKAGMYVFLSIGQSNMSGTNSPVAEGVDIPISSNVKLLNNSNEFEQATHPFRQYSAVNEIRTIDPKTGNAAQTAEGFPIAGFNDPLDRNIGINMTYQFAEDLAAARPDIEIGLIQNSSSGSSVLTYLKDANEMIAEAVAATNEGREDAEKIVAKTANGYEVNVSRVKAAIDNSEAELVGILYHQGCTDAPVGGYLTHLRNMVYELKQDIGGEIRVPFVMGGLPEWANSLYVGANARAKGEIVSFPFMTFASSTEPTRFISRAEHEAYRGQAGVWETDYVHITATSQIEFGHRYYNAYTALRNTIR